MVGSRGVLELEQFGEEEGSVKADAGDITVCRFQRC